MVTYQDLLKVGDVEKDRIAFVKSTIKKHMDSALYKDAVIAEEYAKHKNVTIRNFQKYLYDVTGQAVPDTWTANYKMASRFFDRFITQENQYLLGNGVTWQKDDTADRLGGNFDTVLAKLGRYALIGAVSFGFWNFDHLEGFKVTEFVPLEDEENGALMAGIRFWQIDSNKPLRATLYEVDGYTDYYWGKDAAEGIVLHDKRPYILKINVSEADGMEIYDGVNYPSFPIVPLWANENKQSELVGLREQIDCYDLIKSGYADNVEDGSLIYWTLSNAGGMTEQDLARFVEKMKSMRAAQLDDGVKADAHSNESPYQSREALLAKLRADLYEDAMALDTKNIADGAITATQIEAAYEPLNSKVDQYEYCVNEFVSEILRLAGIDDEPTFTRSTIVNVQEMVQIVLQASTYLSEDYVTKKILTLLGDGDLADGMINEISANEYDRFRGVSSDVSNEGEGKAEEE
jgi:hypothetical protein